MYNRNVFVITKMFFFSSDQTIFHIYFILKHFLVITFHLFSDSDDDHRHIDANDLLGDPGIINLAPRSKKE